LSAPLDETTSALKGPVIIIRHAVTQVNFQSNTLYIPISC